MAVTIPASVSNTRYILRSGRVNETPVAVGGGGLLALARVGGRGGTARVRKGRRARPGRVGLQTGTSHSRPVRVSVALTGPPCGCACSSPGGKPKECAGVAWAAAPPPALLQREADVRLNRESRREGGTSGPLAYRQGQGRCGPDIAPPFGTVIGSRREAKESRGIPRCRSTRAGNTAPNASRAAWSRLNQDPKSGRRPTRRPSPPSLLPLVFFFFVFFFSSYFVSPCLLGGLHRFGTALDLGPRPGKGGLGREGAATASASIPALLVWGAVAFGVPH